MTGTGGFVCQGCGRARTHTVNTRPIGEGRLRRRECPKCNLRFTTIEVRRENENIVRARISLLRNRIIDAIENEFDLEQGEQR